MIIEKCEKPYLFQSGRPTPPQTMPGCQYPNAKGSAFVASQTNAKLQPPHACKSFPG